MTGEISDRRAGTWQPLVDKATILIIEDDPDQLRLYAKALRGFQLTCVSNGSDALRAIAENFPDLIILDHVLADGERGTAFLPKIKERAAHVPVIVISGTLGITERMEALQGPLSAHYVLEKPVKLPQLEMAVEKALTECGFGETVKTLRSMERAEKLKTNEPERRFTERLARQHEILNRVRASGEKPNVSALAREFDVVRKTIQRDLKDLAARGQIPAEWLG